MFQFSDPIQQHVAERGQLVESLGESGGGNDEGMKVTEIGKTVRRILARVGGYNVEVTPFEVVVRAKGKELPRMVITDSGKNNGKAKLSFESMGRNPQVWYMDKGRPLLIVKEIRMAMEHLLKESRVEDWGSIPHHLKGSRADRAEQRELEYERKLEAEGKKRRRTNRASPKELGEARAFMAHDDMLQILKRIDKTLALADRIVRTYAKGKGRRKKGLDLNKQRADVVQHTDVSLRDWATAVSILNQGAQELAYASKDVDGLEPEDASDLLLAIVRIRGWLMNAPHELLKKLERKGIPQDLERFHREIKDMHYTWGAGHVADTPDFPGYSN